MAKQEKKLTLVDLRVYREGNQVRWRTALKNERLDAIPAKQAVWCGMLEALGTVIRDGLHLEPEKILGFQAHSDLKRELQKILARVAAVKTVTADKRGRTKIDRNYALLLSPEEFVTLAKLCGVDQKE